MTLRRVIVGAALLALALFTPRPAEASLSVFQTYVGSYGVSTDGFGSTTQSGTISASIPAGATVVGAYLYTSTYFNSSPVGVGGTLNGQAVNYSTNLGTTAPCCTLTAFRADVTSIVQAAYTGIAPGDIYNFNITETSINQDGEALVVVYQLGSLPVSTIGILDGFSAVSGDSTSINFADPLDPTQAGFFAEMRLGIGFSCCNQASTVTVNGTNITTAAGNNDDGLQTDNGSLITVGGYDDPFSPLLPSYANDHERYNLAPQINVGDTTINVRTVNPSNDDNIFLAVFRVLGEGGVNTDPPTGVVPEPATLSLLGLGLGAAALRRRRQARARG